MIDREKERKCLTKIWRHYREYEIKRTRAKDTKGKRRIDKPRKVKM